MCPINVTMAYMRPSRSIRASICTRCVSLPKLEQCAVAWYQLPRAQTEMWTQCLQLLVVCSSSYQVPRHVLTDTASRFEQGSWHGTTGAGIRSPLRRGCARKHEID